MSQSSKQTPREFAVEVVQTLRDAGHEALWAGGCVRDQLLNRTPKDYDVATNAHPETIRQVFGKRRTLPIGAAFGVITVVGPKSAGQIEVATFREDAQYSDGRHPDGVTFSTAEEDAKRRDFTINGLFFDPIGEQVIDYVGGQEDLRRQTIRAIGNPLERIAEDKLRMLRAVRFAATFGFEIEADTMTAVQNEASQIKVVSAERIAAELRRMLVHENRKLALELLRESRLQPEILPEFNAVIEAPDRWQRSLSLLNCDESISFSESLALLMREVFIDSESPSQTVNDVFKRWKLSNDEINGAMWLLENEKSICEVQTPWPKVQRILIADRHESLIKYADIVSRELGQGSDGVEFCRKALEMPPEKLNPEPLISGDDLKQLGISPGPVFKDILEQVRDEQLWGDIQSKDGALEFVKELLAEED